MISEKMKALVAGSSVTRAMFEEGNRLAKIYGRENVYDFSLGNPNVPAPEKVREAAIDLLKNTDPVKLHGYMSNAGFEEVRGKIAASINDKFGMDYDADNIIMTVGAAGGLNVILKVLLNPGDEVITFAPFFSEYRNYVSNYDGNLIVISPDTSTFQPKLDELEEKITGKTKVVLVNSPNNPSGAIYSSDTFVKMAQILEKKEKEFGTSIYLVTDEPYRELAYAGINVPYVPKYYHNTIVGYSYSKSLSLPGERIGYLVIPSCIDDYDMVWQGAGVATRVMGFVNAPSLQQLFVAECLDESTDLSYYERNRNTLYNGLTEMGYECREPEGAFYLFLKTPIDDDAEFCNIAKKYNILIVPGKGFGCAGYARIAYCVSYETIVNSLPKFKELLSEIKSM